MSFVNNFTVYYTIDSEKENPEYKEDSNFLERVKNFIQTNLSSLYSADANRHYLKKSNTSEVMNSLNQILSSSDFDSKLSYSQTIAKRLLDTEKAAQDKIEHLSREVQKGGLIITHFTNTGSEYICLVKIHYIDYYEEETFEESRGLPKKHVILKTCINKLDANHLSDDFYLSDSTKQKGEASARFWWDDFLELKSVFSDKDNTAKSFARIDGALKNTLWNTNRADYWYIRNNLVGYFRTETQFNLEKMIEKTLRNFDLICLDGKSIEEKTAFKQELSNKLQQTVIKNTNERFFDTQFTIDPKEVKAKTKRLITLMDNVELSFKGEVEDFKGRIIPEIDHENKKYLKIYSEEGFNQFSNQQ